MNASSASRPSVIRTRRAVALLALATAASSASAAEYYWAGTSGTASTGTNWFDAAAGGVNTNPAPNSASDDLFFNITAQNANGSDVTVGAELSARSLTFSTSGTTRLVQSGTQSLNLGAGGINLAATSGPVTIGTGNFLYTRLTTSQTWTNNSASILTVRSLSTTATSGAVSLTLNGAIGGKIVFSQGIGESNNNPLSLIVDTASTGSIDTVTSTFSGGTTINRGHVLFSSSTNPTGALGSGAILLGDTSGGANATLTVRSNGFANNITVRGGSSGSKTLITNQSGGAVLNGTITLNDTLTVTSTTDGTLNGAISGVGGIVKGGNSALTLAGANTFTGDLTINSGAFTLANSGSFTFNIGGNGDSNQINGATAGAVAFNGAFIIDVSGAALANGNSWTLVSIGAAETYGSGFSIAGFTQTDDIWTNATGFSFSESTGILTYSAIPEPSSAAALAGVGTLLAAAGRRRAQRQPARD